MMITTCALFIVFFIFMFASLNILFDFGMLTGIITSLALLANLFIYLSIYLKKKRNQKLCILNKLQ